jgi:hypothetical protein
VTRCIDPPTPEQQALNRLAHQLARSFVPAVADIALVVNPEGVIEHVALGQDTLGGSSSLWLGCAWAETVSCCTRNKIDLLLSEAQELGVSRRREVNHLNSSLLAPRGQPEAAGVRQPCGQVDSPHGASPDAAKRARLPACLPAAGQHVLQDEVPFAYSAICLGPSGPIVAVGRDLRAASVLQQRFVHAAQSLERDYWAQLRLADRNARQTTGDQGPARPAFSSVAPMAKDLARSFEQLNAALGLLPLSELLEQAQDLAEKYLIEGALERSQGHLEDTGLLLHMPMAQLLQRMHHLGVDAGPSGRTHGRPN